MTPNVRLLVGLSDVMRYCYFFSHWNSEPRVNAAIDFFILFLLSKPFLYFIMIYYSIVLFCT